MTQTCTSTLNDVVRYIYSETLISENVLIENEIVKDNAVLDFYLDCIAIQSDMSKISLSPNENTITNILDFSRNFKPSIFS